VYWWQIGKDRDCRSLSDNTKIDCKVTGFFDLSHLIGLGAVWCCHWSFRCHRGGPPFQMQMTIRMQVSSVM
jgi:hypothetical protein